MKLPNVEDIYPLSPMQQGMLFHSLYAPETGVYFEQFVCTLQGDLQVVAFQQAWQQMVERHTVLRTIFIWEGLRDPLQIVRQHVTLPWDIQDWYDLSPYIQRQQLESWLVTDRQRGFDLTQVPLLRCFLVKVAAQTYHFVLSHHHILLDGWSIGLLLEEVFTIYDDLCQGRVIHLPPPRRYREYIAWWQQQDMTQAENFWRTTLHGCTGPTPLPFDHGALSTGTHQSNLHICEMEPQGLSEAVTSQLQSLARQHNVTLNTLIQGAWALILSRYSGEMDVIFGTTTSGRPVDLPGAETMIGLFINTLPLRVSVPSHQPLFPWLQQLQHQQIELRQYEYSSLIRVQEWSDLPRGVPLFESIVVFENFPTSGPQEPTARVRVQDVRGVEMTNYPLTLVAWLASAISFKLSYDAERFDTEVMRRLQGQLQTLLIGMAEYPERAIGALPLLTKQEQHQLLVCWNDTQTTFPNNQCLHHLFEAQVEQSPETVAVIGEQQQLTYRELNQYANQVAHHLLSLGIGSGSLVALCFERAPEMVIGLLAVLKIGGAYVPLDPGYPQARLAFMLEDSQAPILLTQQRLIADLPSFAGQVLCLDTDWARIATQRDHNPTSRGTIDSPAYVIYTSGSTGQPKGALIHHAAIVNHMCWMLETFAFDAADRVLQKTPLSFDASIWEFFAPLLSGGQLILAKPEGHRDGDYLVHTIITQHVTTLQLVPTQLRMLLATAGFAHCHSLRQVFCGGEPLSVELIAAFQQQLPATPLYNLYGPSEAAIDTTYWQCELTTGQATVPIGRPIANAQVYVLDPYGQPVPIGVPGELYIGGVGIGQGYLNRPELTADTFVPHPFSSDPNARLYKTGDLVQYLSDGNLVFLGRLDHQIKLRGYRIELGEIEAVLNENPHVHQTVVMCREDLHTQSQHVVAYIVPAQPHLLVDDLRDMLKAKLPEYMLPTLFVTLDQLPLTPNGKIDRHALPAPDTSNVVPSASFVAPRDLIELQLAHIWEQVLGVRPVGITDNYFELGGHSLLAIHLMSEVAQRFQQKLPLSVLFQNPTIQDLAQLLREHVGFLPQSILVGIQPKGSKPPFFCVHPAGGNVICYTDLAQHVSADQPFFGLQDPGLLTDRTPFSTIEEMAACYLSEMRTYQPQGPYYVGGWSLGGLVAFEIAQQLHAQGEEVALLALLDTPLPTPNHLRSDFDQSEAMAAVVREIGRSLHRTIAVSADVLKRLSPDEQMTYIVENIRAAGEAMPEEQLASIFAYAQRYSTVNQGNMAALRQYQPRPYHQEITLFRVQTVDTTLIELYPWYADPSFGWQTISTHPVAVHVVPGEHSTMVYTPHAQALAHQLTMCLEKAHTHREIAL